MRKFFAVTAKVFAVIFAIAFVATTISALFMTGIDRRLMNADVYKEALTEQRVYERMPRIVAEQIVMSVSFDPCTENPLLCETATPDFKDCVRRTLGDERYEELTTGNAYPSQAELQLIQPCMQQYGANLNAPPVMLGPGDNPLPAAPPEVQECVGAALGEQARNALVNAERLPTDGERERITACFTQAGFAVETGGPPSYLENLTVSDWEGMIISIMPPDELQTMTENVLDQTFAYFNGDTDVVAVAMSRLKARIAGQDGLNALLDVIRSQPSCNERELAGIETMLAGRGGQVSLCRPPEETLTRMTPVLEDQLRELAGSLPDQNVLMSYQSFRANTNAGPGETPAFGFRMARLSMRLSADIPLLFLLFITLLAVRTPKTWMRWWGIPAFIAGLISVAFAAMLSAAFEQVWIELMVASLPPYLSIGLVELGHDIASYIIHSLLEGIVLGGIILGVLGLGAWIGSYFIKHEEESIPLPIPAPK